MDYKPGWLLYFQLALISAIVICYEIVATRISSVIYVNNSAFIILSLAILGLGIGGMYAYYKAGATSTSDHEKTIRIVMLLLGVSLLVFSFSVTHLKLDSAPFVYFLLMFLPFFFAGIFFASVFQIYAAFSYKLFAADLIGAASGSILSIITLNIFGALNTVLFLSTIVFISFAGFFLSGRKVIPYVLLITGLLFLGYLIINGDKKTIGTIPIGDFPEKDYHHVYPDQAIKSSIIDSRWSIHGRADLVQYNNQDFVKQLFIDGAAGSQMMRFNGNVENVSPTLINLLFQHSTSIPLIFLQEEEKNNMLVIGPGGGKEVLTGMIEGVDEITGVEINPDFVDIVKDHRDFNGGIYTDFLNVRIFVKEGRNFIRQTNQRFDLLVMALPSTEQLQNVENLSMSENYLLTSEAIVDYLNILTPEGRLIFTVHNRWELIRLLTTTSHAFEKLNIPLKEFQDHLLVLESNFAPTLVIKKQAFTKEEINHHVNLMQKIPEGFPRITHLPFYYPQRKDSQVSKLFAAMNAGDRALNQFIDDSEYNIKPCLDNSPYFYKVKKGVPDYFINLFIAIVLLNLALIFIPLIRNNRGSKNADMRKLREPMLILIFTGIGFMILEISLLQKIILLLGAPTISLAILLSSILIGMGIGSYFGAYLYSSNIHKRLYVASLLIVIYGIIFFSIHSLILDQILGDAMWKRVVASILMITPLAFFLGIPFPSAIQLMKKRKLGKYIPWMYGVNASMAVLGSITASILTMLPGISFAFYAGLLCYAFVFLYSISSNLKKI